MNVVFLVIVVFLGIRTILTYINFKRRMSFNRAMIFYLANLSKASNSNRDLMRLACAYSENQQYQDAYGLYQAILAEPKGLTKDDIDAIKLNMEFCANPVPGINKPTNLNCSYWHDFKLKRLGKRRRMLFTSDDVLETERMLRMQAINSRKG